MLSWVELRFACEFSICGGEVGFGFLEDRPGRRHLDFFVSLGVVFEGSMVEGGEDWFII